MTPGKWPFDSIACDFVGLFHPPSSKGNSYILTCMCHLTNYPIPISIPNKQVETIVQAYLQYIYYIWQIPDHDNWSLEGIWEWFIQEGSRQIGHKASFLSPYHPQSNGVLEKSHSFQNKYLNTFMVNLTGKIQHNFPSLVSGDFQVSNLKRTLSSFFLAEILWPFSWSYSHLKSGALEMKEVFLISKQSDMPLPLQGKISASIDKALTKIIHPQDSLTSSRSMILSASKTMPPPLGNPNEKVVFI